MKFAVTLLSDISSVTAEAFDDVAAGSPSTTVDIRNAAATVANLKAATAVKLKQKDPSQLRLVVILQNGDAKTATVIDATEDSRKCALSSIFASNGDVAIPLYCIKVADAESAEVLATLTSCGKIAPAITVTSTSADAHAASKRSREEASNGGDRSVLSPIAKSDVAAEVAEVIAANNVAPAQQPAARQPAVRVRRHVHHGHIGDDDSALEEDEEDGFDDEEDWEMLEEGEDWTDDDDADGVEWAEDLFGDAVELDPAEKELLTALINYPNPEATLGKVMEGNTAEVMAEIQTTDPRLFQLIGEQGTLFTELMEDIKTEMDDGTITDGAGVVQYLRDLLSRSEAFTEAARLAEEAIGEEVGDGTGARRPQRAENEAAMADTLNALAGGASEVRPLTEADETRIVSLIDLGFTREQSVAAYLRMGRNVERAANYLFENM